MERIKHYCGKKNTIEPNLILALVASAVLKKNYHVLSQLFLNFFFH